MQKIFNIKCKKIGIITATIILVAVIVVLIIFATTSNKKDYRTVLTVDSVPIAYGEFMIVLNEQKASVISYFYGKYHINDNVDFWGEDTVIGGESPIETLRECTKESIVRIKYEQMLMKQYKTVDDISFRNFESLLKKENRDRQNKIQNNIPVYGPTKYTKQDYYNYLHSVRISDLRAAIYKESGLDNIEYKFTNELLDKKVSDNIHNLKIVLKDLYYEITP